MSPRRSSRARSSANPPPASQTASSSSASTLKHTHTDQRSESIDEPVEDTESQATTEPIMQPRRSRRNGVDDSPNKDGVPHIEDEEEDEIDENVAEEEITRCICGQVDYPGPSETLRAMVKGQPLEALGDELGSFFVCCDKCSVWQHGGCVALTNEDTLPDQYFCEQCRPELHKIVAKSSHGTKSSLYRPVLDVVLSSRSSSASSEQRKNSKSSKNAEPPRRRATMNSRVAYDEDEMLRRAIEESKHDGSATLGKRARNNDDDSKPALKRQRTVSTSSGSDLDRSLSPGTADQPSKPRSNLRGAAARNNIEKEARDKAKADALAAKAEAANRRNARSERRRNEDSPPPTPSLSPSKSQTQAHPKLKTSNSTNHDPIPLSNSSHKKKTAVSRLTASNSNSHVRRGRLGRNQYTRDREVDSETLIRDTSHDRDAGNAGSPNGVNSDHGEAPSKTNHSTHTSSSSGHRANGVTITVTTTAGGSGKQSKAKTHPARTSMNEMKRRVAAILEFVGQMQTKVGGNTGSGKATPESRGSSNGNGKGGGKLAKEVAGLVQAVQDAAGALSDDTTEGVDGTGADGVDEEGAVKKMVKMRDDNEFRDLGSADMMETLSRELVAWQRVYGVWSR